MAVWYTFPGGNDANAGNGAGAGAAWKTLDRLRIAINAATINSGDTINIGAGAYLDVITIDAVTRAAGDFFNCQFVGDVGGAVFGTAGSVYIYGASAPLFYDVGLVTTANVGGGIHNFGHEFYDLSFAKFGTHAVKTADTDNVVTAGTLPRFQFVRCTFHPTSQYAIESTNTTGVDTARIEIKHCTFAGFYTPVIGSTPRRVEDSIFFRGNVSGSANGRDLGAVADPAVSPTYNICNLSYGYAVTVLGTGVYPIALTPRFVDPTSDFRLREDSPANATARDLTNRGSQATFLGDPPDVPIDLSEAS